MKAYAFIQSLCTGVLLLLTGMAAIFAPAHAHEVAPTPGAIAVTILQTKLSVNNATADGHDFPVIIFAPEAAGHYPVVIFSSGAFSSPDRYHNMLKPVAAAGFIVLAPTHLDAEVLALDPKPSAAMIWNMRQAELAHLATLPGEIVKVLANKNLTLDRQNIALLGHSYGALMAQMGAGAIATGPDGKISNNRLTNIAAIVAFSPPGPMPGAIDARGWSRIATPSLTITGTADIFPGFVDDWKAHIVSYEATAVGDRWLWVGDDVNHYFSGLFGRSGAIPPAISDRFDHAIATSIAFLNWHLKGLSPLQDTMVPDGITLTKD